MDELYARNDGQVPGRAVMKEFSKNAAIMKSSDYRSGTAMHERISVDRNVCGGQPCVTGTRIMVWCVLSLLGVGESIEQVLEAYPDITREDVLACIRYATEVMQDYREIPA